MATVTHAELYYDGSCAIDEALIEAAKLREFEAVDIYDVDNGERFSTYIIKAERDSGIISINGAAARRVQVSDKIIIAAYAYLQADELEEFQPSLVYLDQYNNIRKTDPDQLNSMQAL